MNPSPFWQTKLAAKDLILDNDSLRAFRRNELGKHIDDHCIKDAAFQRVDARARQAWRALRHHIPKDLEPLIEDLEVGEPRRVHIRGKWTTTGSIEFAYLAGRLREYIGAHTCEIGAGYGGLARALVTMTPHRYTIVDFPTIQRIQELYLQDFDMEWLEPGEPLPACDLYINTRSMFEMTLDQIGWYFERMTGPAHFFSMNKDKITRMRDWPVPKSWEKVDERKNPLNQAMIEQIYRIPEPEE